MVAVFIVCYTLDYRTFAFTVTYERRMIILHCFCFGALSFFILFAYGSKLEVHNVRYSATRTLKQTPHPLSLPSLSLFEYIYIGRYRFSHFYLGQLIIKN